MAANISILDAEKVGFVSAHKLPNGENHLSFEFSSDDRGRSATQIAIFGLSDEAHALLLEALKKAQTITGGTNLDPVAEHVTETV